MNLADRMEALRCKRDAAAEEATCAAKQLARAAQDRGDPRTLRSMANSVARLIGRLDAADDDYAQALRALAVDTPAELRRAA